MGGVCDRTDARCRPRARALRLLASGAALAAVAGCGSPVAQTPGAPAQVRTQGAATPALLPGTPATAVSAPPVAIAPAPPAKAPALAVPRPLTVAAPRAAAPVVSTPVAPVRVAPAPAAGPPHIMVIVMENREASSVIGQPDAPYITSLANAYGEATQWYGVAHPSLPNYLAMISGSTQGVQDDGTSYSFAGPTLVDQLAARGIGWRAYMEDMPSPCFTGASSGGYAKKHDPFMYFTSITSNPSRCNRVVPHTDLATDLQAGTAPPFLFVTPNLCDDGHDCGNASADTWLRSEMQMVMASSWYRNRGTVIITWDEGGSNLGCCGGAAGGQIATIVVTAAGQRRLATPGDHYGMLRAIEEAYGVAPLGGAASGANGDLRPLFAR